MRKQKIAEKKIRVLTETAERVRIIAFKEGMTQGQLVDLWSRNHKILQECKA